MVLMVPQSDLMGVEVARLEGEERQNGWEAGEVQGVQVVQEVNFS